MMMGECSLGLPSWSKDVIVIIIIISSSSSSSII